MSRLFAVALAAVALAGPATAATELGDRLSRTFPLYFAMPTTMKEAAKKSWVAGESEDVCVEGRGIPYKMTSEVNESTTLYYTPAGQVSGIAIDVFGEPPSAEVVSQGVYEVLADGHYRMSVVFRDPASICSQTTVSEIEIGDRLVVNPHTINYTIPLTAAEALDQGFFEGSCTVTMGYHYMRNLVANSSAAETIMPVVPMYNNEGEIHGVRFHSHHKQQDSLLDTNHWDPLTITMCTNTCDDACSETSGKWSTYHVMFKNVWKSTTCSWTCVLTCC